MSPPISNIICINLGTQIIRLKLHQAGVLDSLTLLLSHAISHCIRSVFILINSIHYSVTEKASCMSQPCSCYSSCSFPAVPFHPLPKFLSHYTANFSLLHYEPRETWGPLLFSSHHPISSIWALWRRGTVSYLSLYPRCLAPQAMNVPQRLVELNKFKFYILKFYYFS